MKKIGILMVLVIFAIGSWLFMSTLSSKPSDVANQSNTNIKTATPLVADSNSNKAASGSIDFADANETWADSEEEPVVPATEIYQNAQDALAAVKKAAEGYDDLVMEQFVELGPDCTWCTEFYSELTKTMVSAPEDSDEKSYYAEILASSGRPENIESLISELKNLKPDSPDFGLYADALEMTVGGEKVVEVLAKNLDSDNEELKESVVAAISNQGSAFAIDTLYRHTVDSGIEDGYYSKGIGIGEVIPEKDSFPLMREMISKKDNLSGLAAKGLLNAGVEGLQVVFEALNNSSDVENDKKLLEGATEHITYDDETEQYLRDVVSKSSNPALVEFANQGIEYLSEEGKK
jgi:hypothetical protein